MWTGSLAPRLKIRIIRILNRMTLCNFFIVHTYFTKVAAGRIIQPDGFRFGDINGSPEVKEEDLLC